jgi:hypothetical protein
MINPRDLPASQTQYFKPQVLASKQRQTRRGSSE